MSKLNKDKKSCRDVFNAFMLSNVDYAGNLEIPIINLSTSEPTELISFSKINKCTEYNKWVHFYEHDYIIERICKYPEKYLQKLKQFKGVITPDFSLYRDMPFTMQINNIFRSHQIGRWLQNEGIDVITNIRYGDDRTYKIACLGVPKHSTVAIGTYGSIKDKENRKYLEAGLPIVFNTIRPKTLVIYGSVTALIKDLCQKYNTQLIVFQSELGKTHDNTKEVK